MRGLSALGLVLPVGVLIALRPGPPPSVEFTLSDGRTVQARLARPGEKHWATDSRGNGYVPEVPL